MKCSVEEERCKRKGSRGSMGLVEDFANRINDTYSSKSLHIST